MEDTMTAIKHKSRAEGGDRTHSIAMSLQYMSKMYEWSSAQCNTSLPADTMEKRMLKVKHLEFRAFAALAWMCFARYATVHNYITTSNSASDYYRCFEMTKLKYKDISLFRTNEKAFNLQYHRVHLRDRKGWQKKLSKTDKEGGDLQSKLLDPILRRILTTSF